MLSMTQLSWSVLHAVGDINNHNQRLAGQHDASWVRRHREEPGAAPMVTTEKPGGGGVRKGCVKRARKRRVSFPPPNKQPTVVIWNGVMG